MCYAKPGPRCASYTRPRLEKAQQVYEKDPSPTNYGILQEMQKNHDATLGGQKEIIEIMDSQIWDAYSLEREVLAGRLLQGRKIFEYKISSLKVAEVRSKREADLLTEEKSLKHREKLGKPIVTEPSKLQPAFTHRFFNLINSGVDVEYNRYCPSGYDHDSDYGICRDSELENLKIESIDSHQILRSLYGLSYDEEIPQEILDLGEDLKLGDVDSYEVSASQDYYGEEASVDFYRSETNDAIANYYYGKPNATDAHGVLEYCRHAGLDTTGKTPLQAVKKYLSIKHGHKMDDLLTEVSYERQIGSHVLSISNIEFDEEHPEFASSSPEKFSLPASKVQGIVLGSGYDPYRGEYQVLELLDGHEKIWKLWDTNEETGVFIVLTRE